MNTNPEPLGLSPEDWRDSCPSLRALSVADKARIYRQGDRCAFVFWLIQGIVKLLRLTDEGSELSIALLPPGEIFGGVQADHPCEETAKAVGDVSLYRVSRSDFKSLLSDRPALAWRVIETLSVRRRRAEHKLQSILTQTVETRLVATLKELAALFGVRCSHGYALEIRLTQQELADLVGASRPVVSTLMNALRSRGTLDYTRDLICLNYVAFSELHEG